jgi:hypothetical protein
MARRRNINDIDEDEDGLIVDYSGDSDDDNKSKEDLPEEAFKVKMFRNKTARFAKQNKFLRNKTKNVRWIFMKQKFRSQSFLHISYVKCLLSQRRQLFQRMSSV